MGPEVRAQALFRDRFIGVVRLGHWLIQGDVTPSRYAAGRHVFVSRQGLDTGPIDEALKSFGLEREIVTIVGGFTAALEPARASDLIARVPERHTGDLRAGTIGRSHVRTPVTYANLVRRLLTQTKKQHTIHSHPTK